MNFKIYFTTDMHGHVFPVDYGNNKPSCSGILNLARQYDKDGNTLIIDGGDILQGTPFSQYYIENPSSYPLNPMSEAMNAAGYDYITLGNHDFNYGYDTLKNYLKALNAKCLCANVEDLKGELGIIPYTVHMLENGLRIGITGIVTDFVNVWEQQEHLEFIKVHDSFEYAAKMCKELKDKCDISVCIYHGGFERDLGTGRILTDSRENIAWQMCRELDYDILLTGHQHMPIKDITICGTHAVQTEANAGQYARLDAVYGNSGLSVKSALVPAGSEHCPELYNRLLPLEEKVQSWLDQPVGTMEESIAPEGKLEAALYGSKVAALFNAVQLEATGADFSCTSLGNDPVGLSSPVTYRGISAAYLFSNTLVVLEVNEDVMKTALERCASYFTLINGLPQVSEEFLKPKIEHYNYDFFSGISYAFDLRRPLGDRVVKLCKSDGTPLGNKSYKLCTSNYRATGTGGYDVLKSCPVLWRGGTEMPELVSQYIKKYSPLPPVKGIDIKVEW